MKKYAIGIDFGTLSARALLVDLENGRVVVNIMEGLDDEV